MDTINNTLENLVAHSSLSQNDKEEFIRFFSNITEADRESIVRLISEEPNLIEVLSLNIKAKQSAAIGDDDWKRIIAQEVEFLTSLE